jgi:hypothetical protein
MRNRRFTRRLFAVLMVFVMVVGFIPTTVLAVDGINSPPTVVSGQEIQAGVATPASGDGSLPAVAYTVYTGDWFTDADGDPLTYSVVSAAYGTDDVSADVSISGGTIAYTPASAQAGGTVIIVVSANDGAADSTGNVTINVTVNPVPADTGGAQPPTEPSGQGTQTGDAAGLFRTMAVAPTFTKDLKTYETVALNADLKLSVTVTDAESYQWESSANKETWTGIDTATGASYQPVTASAGTVYYRVTASSEAGSVTSNVVNVTVLPEGSTATASFGFNADNTVECEVGDTKYLTASASGSTKINYRWFQNGDSKLSSKSATAFFLDTSITAEYSVYCVVTIDNIYNFESDHIKVQISAAETVPENAYDFAPGNWGALGEQPDHIYIAGASVYAVTTQGQDWDTMEFGYRIQLDYSVADDEEFSLFFRNGYEEYSASYGCIPVISSNGDEFGTKVAASAVADAAFRKLDVKLSGGKAQVILYVYDSSRDYTMGTRTKLILDFSKVQTAITDATPGAGQWVLLEDLFRKSKAYLALPYGAETAEVTLAVRDTSSVKVGDGTPITVMDGRCIISLPSTTDSHGESSAITLMNGEEAIREYEIICRSAQYDDLPDAVTDYLVIGSQYTNARGTSTYGIRGVGTLLGSTGTVSDYDCLGPATLGSFGGYITYYYEDAIYDDPNKPYGVDFITFGNSVEGSNEFGEPGQVWVSENGTDWYALAGSIHYDNCAIWNCSITYTKAANGSSTWTDSLGRSFDAGWNTYEYPLRENYPLHVFAEGEEEEMTLIGILLLPQGEANEYGNTLPPFTDFGYTDVGQRSNGATGVDSPENGDNVAGNPYQGSITKGTRTYLATTDGMDLAWAVDADGQPVAFPNGIHYVKIATASNIDNGAIGEKSTEVNMVRVAAASGSAVGVTAAPTGITVDGVALSLTSGTYVYNDVVVDGPFAVRVDAPEGTNVYINSIRGKDMYFSSMPDHRMLRIIVQEGQKEPVIYYLNLVETAENPEPAATLTLDPNGGTVNGSTEAVEVKFDAHMSGIVLPTPTIRNKNVDFAGWYSAGQKLYTTYPSEVADLTLMARWSVKPGSGGPSGTINVSFRLIGSTLAELEDELDTIDLADGDYKGAKYVTWIATVNYAMHEGDTVYDLFVKALNNAGLRSVGAEQGYVRTIYAPSVLGGHALSEFTNGKNSGWMYTINGIHPLYGVTEQELSNGDKVIWHYVNDYAWEVEDWAKLGGSGWPQLSTPAHNYWNKWLEAEDRAPNPSDASGGPSLTSAGSSTLTPKATATNGAASVTISTSDIAPFISDAKAKNSTSIIIAPEITGTASKVSVDIPKSSLSSIASKTDAGLTVETTVGSITIPNGALASIASQAQGDTVTVSLESVDNTTLTPAQQEAVGDSPVYDINVFSGGRNISGFGGESITISLPYTLPEGEDPSSVTVWYLNDAGVLEQIACTYDPLTGMATFTTDHLSYYVVGYSEAAPPPVPGQVFSDVSPTDWFYDSVIDAVYRGLMNGTSATTFSPNDQMTRAMLVTVLHRLEGSPVATGASSFTDVKNGEWYTDAVTWANTNNIVTGYGGGLFGTDDSVTREQMATILHRYASYKNYDTTRTADLASYTDAPEINDWALDALQWANAGGLITGRTTTTLAPGGSATRAEVAAIIVRFVDGIVR